MNWKKKYKNLSDEHGNLQVKIKQMMVEKKEDRVKRLEFDEKIDELNQETDTLLDEIEKWQMSTLNLMEKTFFFHVKMVKRIILKS